MFLFVLHLSFQLCQQRHRILTDSEGDCAGVVAGGLQSKSVQGQDASHRLAVWQGAVRDGEGTSLWVWKHKSRIYQTWLLMCPNMYNVWTLYLWISLCKSFLSLLRWISSLAWLWLSESRSAKWTLGFGVPSGVSKDLRRFLLSDRMSSLWDSSVSGI